MSEPIKEEEVKVSVEELLKKIIAMLEAMAPKEEPAAEEEEAPKEDARDIKLDVAIDIMKTNLKDVFSSEKLDSFDFDHLAMANEMKSNFKPTIGNAHPGSTKEDSTSSNDDVDCSQMKV